MKAKVQELENELEDFANDPEENKADDFMMNLYSFSRFDTSYVKKAA